MYSDQQLMQFAPQHRYYAGLVKEAGITPALQETLKEFERVTALFNEQNASIGYAEGKWSPKELIQHLIDSERIFCYRALRFARKDHTPLSGYDHENYVHASSANRRPLADLVREMILVRESTLLFFSTLPEHSLALSGEANSNQVTVELLGIITAGHMRHHVLVLNEKYLSDK